MMFKKKEKKEDWGMLQQIKLQIAPGDTIDQLTKAKELVQKYLYDLYDSEAEIRTLILEAKKARDDLKRRIKARKNE